MIKIIKFIFFLFFLSGITLTQAKSVDLTQPNHHQLNELTPFLENLSKARSLQETAQILEKYLEKATDIAIANIKKSGSTIPEEKLENLRQTIHDELETLLDDLYIPVDID